MSRGTRESRARENGGLRCCGDKSVRLTSDKNAQKFWAANPPPPPRRQRYVANLMSHPTLVLDRRGFMGWAATPPGFPPCPQPQGAATEMNPGSRAPPARPIRPPFSTGCRQAERVG